MYSLFPGPVSSRSSCQSFCSVAPLGVELVDASLKWRLSCATKCRVNVLRLLQLTLFERHGTPCPGGYADSSASPAFVNMEIYGAFQSFQPKHLVVFFASYHLRWQVFLGSHQISILSCTCLLAEGSITFVQCVCVCVLHF